MSEATIEVATTESLDFQRCACIGVMPGRACVLCNNTKWLKRCTECNGSGKIFLNVRSGSQPRADIHGRCMGRGWLPCQAADLEAIFSTATPAAIEGEAPQLAGNGKKNKSIAATTSATTPATP